MANGSHFYSVKDEHFFNYLSDTETAEPEDYAVNTAKSDEDQYGQKHIERRTRKKGENTQISTKNGGRVVVI